MKPEEIEQCKLMDWIRSMEDVEPYVFHIANERETSFNRGRILKRMGVKAGVSDLFIGIPKGKFHGMFLELKAGNATPRPSQLTFIETMATQGYYCVWCAGSDNAKETIRDYLALQTPSS